MTENKIIKVLDDIWTFGHEPTDEERLAANKAIALIQELEQYRAIGTVEECREARERQRVKKPVKDEYDHKCCPNCGWVVYKDEWGGRYLTHCENCGQAISWGGRRIMPIAHIEPPTKEEIEEYKKSKHEEFLKSFSDKEKMQRMKPKAVGRMGRIKFGICPKCNHCLVESDRFCGECFQRIDWIDNP